MKRVVVGLDGSPPSFAALRWAAMLASRADLDLVAAWAWLPGTVDLDPASTGSLLAAARRGLESWCAAAHPAKDPELVLVQGDARPALLAVAEEQHADLLVVGPRGIGGPAGIRIGSVTSDLAHHTDRPLAIVPPETAGLRIDHVVLGVDGSAGCTAAIDFCADLAAALGVSVTATLAYDPLLEWVPAHDRHGWRRHAENRVDEWVDPLRSAGVTVDVEVDRDIHPAATLARATAAHAGSIAVVGAHKLGGLTGLRRGRLPLQFLRQAVVPVVVVPAEHAAHTARADEPGGSR